MKIRIDVDERIEEDEVIIRCKNLNDEIYNIQRVLTDMLSQKAQIAFYKNNVDY